MKALDHEIEAVATRSKGKRRLYLFSLLSVVDAPMVDVSYARKKPNAVEVEQISHLARYMVRRRDLSALIHFVRSDKLPKFVGALSNLADLNAKQMASLVRTAYDAIRSNSTVRAYFAERLKPRFVWRITQCFQRNERPSLTVVDLGLDYENDKLAILVDTYDEDDLAILNADKVLKSESAKLLKEIAQYEGDFAFDSDIPF